MSIKLFNLIDISMSSPCVRLCYYLKGNYPSKTVKDTLSKNSLDLKVILKKYFKNASINPCEFMS